MEGTEEAYLYEKPSKINRKKAKYGKSGRCGATLRKDIEADLYLKKNKRNGEAIILKHYSTTDDWDSSRLKSHCDSKLPDGGLTHETQQDARRNLERGSHSRCIIADAYYWTRRTPPVAYSLNKRKRWNLTKMLNDEIQDQMNEDPVVDVVMIERSVARNSGMTALSSKPDVTNLASTTLAPRKVDEGKRKKQKKKKSGKKAYSYASDLLGMSQKGPENEENVEPVAHVKPQVTYEICTPRATHKYPNFYQDKYTNCYQDKYPWHAFRDVQRKGRKMKHRENWNPSIHEVTWSDEEDVEVSEVTRDNHKKQEKFVIDSLMKNMANKQVNKMARTCRRMEEQEERKEKKYKDQKTDDLEQSYTVAPSPVTDSENENATDVISQQGAAAETSLQTVLEADQERSAQIQIKYAVFRKMEQKFNNLTTSVNSHGWTVYRSQCHPPKYAMKMNRPVRELWLKRCPEVFITCEKRVEDYKKCEVIVKTAIVSEEEEFKELRARWATSIQQEVNCSGEKIFKVKGLLKLAERTFCALANEVAPDLFKASDAEDSCQVSAQLYKERVEIKALELSGYQFKTIPKKGITFDERMEYLAQPDMETGDFCGICFVALNDGDYVKGSALKACKHWFCFDCWLQHASYSNTRGALYPFRCPAADCSESIDDVTLMTLLPGDVIAKHRRLQNETSIAKSRESYVCPKCKMAVKVSSMRSGGSRQGQEVTPIPVQCSCNAKWCSGCFNAPHWPASCKANEAYLEEKHKYYLVGANVLIKTVNGQKCPSCRMPIQKNGGCNMMTCSCGHFFCWKCLKPAEHCSYQCSPFGSVDLEVSDLEETKLGFVSMAEAAIETCKTFEQTKEHRERIRAIRQTLQKMQHQDAKTISTGIDMEHAVTYCDAVRHILQYMQVQIGYGHLMKAVQIRKLAKITKSVQSILVCAERHLFNQQCKIVDAVGFQTKLSKFQMAIDTELGKVYRIVH